MERFFDGTDQENSKNKEGKYGGKKKKSSFFLFLKISFYKYGVSILLCSLRNTLGLLPLCDPPSQEPTHMGTSLTT
jgi:hypothetical protein